MQMSTLVALMVPVTEPCAMLRAVIPPSLRYLSTEERDGAWCVGGLASGGGSLQSITVWPAGVLRLRILVGETQFALQTIAK